MIDHTVLVYHTMDGTSMITQSPPPLSPQKPQPPVSPFPRFLSSQGPLRRRHRLQQALLAHGRERAPVGRQLGLLPPARHVLLERRVGDDPGKGAAHPEEPHPVGVLVEEEDAGRQDDQELEVPCLCVCFVDVWCWVLSYGTFYVGAWID